MTERCPPIGCHWTLVLRGQISKTSRCRTVIIAGLISISSSPRPAGISSSENCLCVLNPSLVVAYQSFSNTPAETRPGFSLGVATISPELFLVVCLLCKIFPLRFPTEAAVTVRDPHELREDGSGTSGPVQVTDTHTRPRVSRWAPRHAWGPPTSMPLSRWSALLEFSRSKTARALSGLASVTEHHRVQTQPGRRGHTEFIALRF